MTTKTADLYCESVFWTINYGRTEPSPRGEKSAEAVPSGAHSAYAGAGPAAAQGGFFVALLSCSEGAVSLLQATLQLYAGLGTSSRALKN